VVPDEPRAAADDGRDEALCCTVLPEAVLPEAALAAALLAGALLAGADAEVLADLVVFLLVVFWPAVFLAGFVPGPTPILGWPVPVLETVVTGWPGAREPDRKGKIA
jgi:hypothetical protein